MKDYQERVIIDREKLINELDRLVVFMDGLIFLNLELKEQELLKKQYRIMEELNDVLEERIKLWANIQ